MSLADPTSLPGDLIKEGSDAGFMADVIEASKTTPVIVDFWATWCGPCKASIPHLIELQKEYGTQGLEVVGISLDTTGPKAVGTFATGQKINYTILMGNDQVAAAYGGIKGIPVAFVVTQDGKIFRRYIGYRDKKVYDSDVRALLGLGPAGTAKS